MNWTFSQFLLLKTSIETGNWVEYNPIATLDNGSSIEFCVSGSGQDYLDAASTQLYVKARILQADGTAIAGDAQVVSYRSVSTLTLFRRRSLVEWNPGDLVKQYVRIQSIY